MMQYCIMENKISQFFFHVSQTQIIVALMNHSGARRRIVSASTSESRFSQASAPQGDDVFLIVNNPSPSTPQVDNDDFLISSDAGCK